MTRRGSTTGSRRYGAGALALAASLAVGVLAQPAAAAAATTAPTAPATADTPQSGPSANESEAQMPGAVPVPGPASAGFQLAAAGGSTTSYLDQSGVKTFRVDSGYDLDQYLYAPSSPLDASIDVDTAGGPVDADGFPAPGNAFHGGFGRLTLRVFDVDEDYAGTDIVREIDEVLVNGQRVGALAGADSQWSVVSFAVPMSSVRLPAHDGESARNDIQVLIDTGNGGTVNWAVQVDWAELRLTDEALPAALMHGITAGGPFMSDMRDFYTLNVDDLRGRVITPTVTRNGSIADNVALMEGPLRELRRRTGSAQVNITAHSMGGLNTRLYIAENPGVVRGLVMVGTPNGGSQLADILCGNRNIPFLLKGIAPLVLDEMTKQFGPCDGPGDGLYQLQESYVQDVFNKQVLDSPGVEASTIAGQGNAPGNLLLDGEDDGTVSVDSVRYLRPASDDNADHPGLQTALRPSYERNHVDLALAGSEALPRSLCTLYRLLYRCSGNLYLPSGSVAASSLPTDAPTTTAAIPASAALTTAVTATDGVVVPANGGAELALGLEAAEQAVVTVVTGTPAVTGTIDGVPMTAGDLLGVPALSAQRAGGDTSIRLHNASAAPVTVSAFGAVRTDRALTVEAVAESRAGAPVNVPIRLTRPDGDDVVDYRVRDAAGAVIASGQLVPVQGTSLLTFTPVTAGAHTVDAWVDGASPRSDSRVLAVTSPVHRIGSAMTHQPVDDDGDGDFDALLVDVPVDVATAGSYRLAGRLGTPGGTASVTLVEVDLPAGASQVTLRFSGRDIGESRLDGPYALQDVTLATSGLALLDEVASLGRTSEYSWRAFEHAAVLIDDVFADRGVDQDGDGLFERLLVEGHVTVDDPGTYAVNGRLVDASGQELGEYQTVTGLGAGRNPLQLVFSGEAIGKSGADGPYRLVDLSVYALGAQDALGFLVRAASTEAYSNEQFVGSRMTFPQLRALVQRYVTEGVLDPGTGRSLVAKVDAASAAAERGQPKTTTAQLEALRRELEALNDASISNDARSALLQAVRRLSGS